MNLNDYLKLRNYIQNHLGLEISKEPRPLISSKLSRFSQKHTIMNWSNFINDLFENNLSEDTVDDLIDIFVVGHTSFFRNRKQFELLKSRILPELTFNKTINTETDLRIWSAGCSTGEEVYSILITLMEYFGEKYKDITCGVLATDISQKALNQAAQGQYKRDETAINLSGLLTPYIKKINHDTFEIKSKIKQEATFRKLNLSVSKYPFINRFDIIFCRNVFLYFNGEHRKANQLKIVKSLNSGGYLFLGDAEKFDFESFGLSRIGNGIYKNDNFVF